MTRCMLHDKELPKKFWAKATNSTVFLYNRLPTKALNDKTSFEACLTKHSSIRRVARPIPYSDVHRNWHAIHTSPIRMPSPDPVASVSNKILDRVSWSIINYLAKSMLDRTFWGQRKEVSSSVEEVRTLGNCSGPDSFSPQQNSTKVLIDNQAAIAISHNLVFHGKTKHFKIKLFFLRKGWRNRRRRIGGEGALHLRRIVEIRGSLNTVRLGS
uniref:Retrovirus-related Pol polyprotein from transposon TNT 1-94 n=1 Tax=Vitis vinifera TaxID=29760 RepID=A5BSV3_VITVI|nr:hypothetical protein VITISV_026757 [Vitis vinifera]